MKRFLVPFAKSLAGTVVGLLLLELALRLLTPPPADLMQLSRVVESERGKFAQYDALLGWAGKPGAAADFRWIDAHHHVRQNRYGWRGAEYPEARGERRRVLVLGDSFAWGFGVEDDELFTTLLEDGAGGAVEVINTGVSGYGTDQEYLLWRERARAWQPDDVVLVLTPYTDIVDNLFDRRYGYPKPRFVRDAEGELVLTNVPVPATSDFSDVASEADVETLGPLARLCRGSWLARRLVAAASRSPKLRAAMEHRRLIPRRLPGYDWERPLYQTAPSEQTRQAWDVMLGLLEMLHRDVAAGGGRLTVCVVPSIVQVYPELWRQFAPGPGADVEAPNRILGTWGREHGVPVLDPLPEFRAAGTKDPYLYFPYNRHWTPAGHVLVAAALARQLDLPTAP